MSTPRVGVIGAGLAGWASVAAIRSRGWEPVLIARGIGASAMSSGAADLRPWTDGNSPVPDDAPYLESLRELGLFDVGSAWVATAAGVLRNCCAVGAGIYRVPSSGRIALLDVGRRDFPADQLARAYNERASSLGWSTRFEIAETAGIWQGEETRKSLLGFARLMDDEERAATLKSQLSELRAGAGLDGVLLGPWLGTNGELARWASGEGWLGEVLSPTDGPFGFRWEATRDRCLSGWGVRLHDEEVRAVRIEEAGYAIESGGDKTHRFVDALVLATGGLVGGGVQVLLPHVGAGRGEVPRVSLDPRESIPHGSWDGWDPNEDGGLWAGRTSALQLSPSRPGENLQFAGGGSAQFDTVFSTIESAWQAVGRLSL